MMRFAVWTVLHYHLFFFGGASFFIYARARATQTRRVLWLHRGRISEQQAWPDAATIYCRIAGLVCIIWWLAARAVVWIP